MPSAVPCASHVYYLEVGLGRWVGDFGFRVTDWRAFRRDPIGLSNRFLVLAMALTARLPGRMRIDSVLAEEPARGERRVVHNDVRIRKWGVTLYLLRERYLLNPDCRAVWVESRERFGPLPFLFNVRKEHPARIEEGGLRAVYTMPLLGAEWEGRYTVRADRDHIDAALVGPWAEAKEVIGRDSAG